MLLRPFYFFSTLWFYFSTLYFVVADLIFLLPLYFAIAALVFAVALLFCCRCFSFLSPLYFFLAALIFCCRLIGEGNIKRQRKKAARKKVKRRQSNNKAATKNTERLCMALLGFRNIQIGSKIWVLLKTEKIHYFLLFQKYQWFIHRFLKNSVCIRSFIVNYSNALSLLYPTVLH